MREFFARNQGKLFLATAFAVGTRAAFVFPEVTLFLANSLGTSLGTIQIGVGMIGFLGEAEIIRAIFKEESRHTQKKTNSSLASLKSCGASLSNMGGNNLETKALLEKDKKLQVSEQKKSATLDGFFTYCSTQSQFCYSFFSSLVGSSKEISKERTLAKAFDDARELVEQQEAEVEEIQRALSQYLSELDARERKISHEIEKKGANVKQMLFQPSSTEKSAECKVPADNVDQADQLKQLENKLRNYPTLPGSTNLTVADVDSFGVERSEYHVQVKNLAADCLKGRYLSLSQSATSGNALIGKST